MSDKIIDFSPGSPARARIAKEGLIPSRYFHKTTHSLRSANGSKMNIEFKLPKAFICKGKSCVPQSFVLVKDITNQIILGVPFINDIFPLTHWDNNKIIGTWGNKPFILEFVTKPFTRMINDLTAKLLSKNNQVSFIKQEINSIEIDHILQNPKLKEKIAILKNQFSIEICGDHPNTFWNRKKHVVSLPYEES